MRLSFTKMQSLGNDFILIDDRGLRLRNINRLSRFLCDRRFGIGADQLLILSNSKKADFKMRIFNPDGSEVEMCGNGIRCLAKYVWDKGFKIQDSKLKIKELKIETLAGIKYIKSKGKLIEVDMGEPILEPERIPVKPDSGIKVQGSMPIINIPLKVNKSEFKITCVSMGNPHAVIVVDDVRSFPVDEYGPMIENHKVFPKRTNVEFIQVKDRRNIIMRVWERGVGETMACGTGASAVTVASSLLGLTDRKITVYLLGGRLRIEWAKRDNHVYMAGPATTVFEGSIWVKR
ncbi:MAG: diaminopimelate epimerase [Thermodesulfovibrionia bacterium]